MAEKTQKRGLGQGLSALFGEDTLENELNGALNLAIEKVEPRLDQPRSVFDESALQELADSISQFGIIQPITVRKLDSGYYQIIAGERRWRAARLAGLKEVPVRVIDADDKRAMELALVENLQREDLNPIEEARGFQSLMQEYGMTQDEASQSVGKSRPAVANSLRLLSLAPPVMAMVEDGDISAGHARTLLPVKDEALQLKMANKVYEEGLSVRQTEQLISKLIADFEKTEEAPTEKQEVEVDYIADTERRLTTALGRKVIIKNNKRRGKIELEYYGNDDREALIDTLFKFVSKKEERI
ncbi:MAG: ParB/RepB/Spo0J family partition protein [Clostridiales bacterium]|nr:ParB/RepB/Spo0J family partition protein [Clostridiales bacterium]